MKNPPQGEGAKPLLDHGLLIKIFNSNISAAKDLSFFFLLNCPFLFRDMIYTATVIERHNMPGNQSNVVQQLGVGYY